MCRKYGNFPHYGKTWCAKSLILVVDQLCLLSVPVSHRPNFTPRGACALPPPTPIAAEEGRLPIGAHTASCGTAKGPPVALEGRIPSRLRSGSGTRSGCLTLFPFLPQGFNKPGHPWTTIPGEFMPLKASDRRDSNTTWTSRTRRKALRSTMTGRPRTRRRALCWSAGSSLQWRPSSSSPVF